MLEILLPQKEMEQKCKLLAFSLLRQKGVEYRRRGSLCSDGPDCLYAELLDLEERKVGELEEKAEHLKEKVEKSLEELTAVKQAHLKFVSDVRRIAEAKRNWKIDLQVFISTFCLHARGIAQLQGYDD